MGDYWLTSRGSTGTEVPTLPESRLSRAAPRSLSEPNARLRGSKEVTRGLHEGPWDPTKIPRIQILMSQDIFLAEAGGEPCPQVEGQMERTGSVRKVLLDVTDRSHNPRVGGSNPPPRRLMRLTQFIGRKNARSVC